MIGFAPTDLRRHLVRLRGEGLTDRELARWANAPGRCRAKDYPWCPRKVRLFLKETTE
jgi:hypothetical protein